MILPINLLLSASPLPNLLSSRSMSSNKSAKSSCDSEPIVELTMALMPSFKSSTVKLLTLILSTKESNKYFGSKK